jgi:NAD(P)-dependent dehydrogenase (short-subunit alcohol dehydrogenase family)
VTEARAVAVVTGANRGIGLGVVGQLAELGYAVALGSRDLEKGESAADSLGSEWVHPVQVDVADDHSVHAAAAEVEERWGRTDVLVNNAAILYDTENRAESVDLDIVRRGFETNLFGAWRTAQAFLPLLRRSEHGRIVNVSSGGGSLSSMGGGTPTYSASKAALNALTRLLASELAGDGILVNSVCPGWVATDMGGPGGRPIEDGAASVVWAATLPDDGPSGGFFRDGEPVRW